MRSLTLPDHSAPTNLRLKDSVQARYVDGDLLAIAKQLRERHPSLYVIELTDPHNEPGKAVWAIMESCQDGVERLVFKAQQLDGRVLKKIDEIMHVPFAARFAKAERETIVSEEEAKEAELDKLYETVGRPMLTQLHHDGFTGSRPLSYPKRGVKP